MQSIGWNVRATSDHANTNLRANRKINKSVEAAAEKGKEYIQAKKTMATSVMGASTRLP